MAQVLVLVTTVLWLAGLACAAAVLGLLGDALGRISALTGSAASVDGGLAFYVAAPAIVAVVDIVLAIMGAVRHGSGGKRLAGVYAAPLNALCAVVAAGLLGGAGALGWGSFRIRQDCALLDDRFPAGSSAYCTRWTAVSIAVGAALGVHALNVLVAAYWWIAAPSASSSASAKTGHPYSSVMQGDGRPSFAYAANATQPTILAQQQQQQQQQHGGIPLQALQNMQSATSFQPLPQPQAQPFTQHPNAASLVMDEHQLHLPQHLQRPQHPQHPQQAMSVGSLEADPAVLAAAMSAAGGAQQPDASAAAPAQAAGGQNTFVDPVTGQLYYIPSSEQHAQQQNMAVAAAAADAAAWAAYYAQAAAAAAAMSHSSLPRPSVDAAPQLQQQHQHQQQPPEQVQPQ
ncbi:hypothetical protein GQ42DRAFT_164520 [Ramicandelaber brevisporus]|nr:hypothetical protein GQ42DRAFT_164520 [Ramicandelaber brevisporus]